MQNRIPVVTNSRTSLGMGSKNPNHYTPNLIISKSAQDFISHPIKIHYPRALIRKRISYSFWKKMVKSISMLPNKERKGIAYNMWLEMDDRHFFGTYKQAGFELESLALSLIEEEEKDGTK
tara:strand:+ start:62180 stop:62542 length:363 start_codon:yes stop_codon:yes gene_type:complete